MLNERERRTLARIERQLVDSDPELARLFRRGGRSTDSGTQSRLLLIAGLAMLVLGGASGMPEIMLAGIMVAVVALVLAHATLGMRRFGIA